MKTSATVAARVRVAVVCGAVLALLAWGFGSRLLGTARAHASDAQALERSLRELGVLLAVGALVSGAAIAIVASSLAVAPFETLTRTARAMRRDLGIRTRVRGEDEVGALGEALDELAAWVGSEKQSLEDDRNRLVAILESMSEGVLVTGPGGPHEAVVVLANAALRQMFLLDSAILGRPPVEAIRVAGLDDILSAAASTRGSASGELEHAGMRPRKILVRVGPIASKDSEQAPALVAVFSDVTELRRLESVRRDFVANVSHELRTPIHAISSSAETLLGGALGDPDAARSFVEIIGRNTSRLRALVEDLLELSRIEAKEWRFEMGSVDPHEAAKAAVDAIAINAEQRGAKVAVDVDAGLVPVHADRRALEQILVNLLDNALKYGGTSPEIELSARREEQRVVFRVRDRGPGIEPRHLTRLFERFYRVDAGRSRAMGGTGLGLSIVKNLVEAMEGTVEVESAVGVGTTFAVSLPVARDA